MIETKKIKTLFQQFVVCFLFSLAYVFTFCLIVKDSSKVGLYIVHSIFSSFLLSFCLSVIFYENKAKKIVLPNIFLLVTSLYIHLSSIKYFGNYYPEFNLSDFERLSGSLLQIFICLLLIVFFDLIGRKVLLPQRNNFKVSNILSFFIWVFIIFFGIYEIYQVLILKTPVYNNDKTSNYFFQFLSRNFLVFVFSLSLFNAKKTFSGLLLPLNYFQPLMVIFVELLISLETGQRNGLVLIFLSALLFLLIHKPKKSKQLFSLLYFAPFLFLIFSYITAGISEKIETVDLVVLGKYLSYRSDQSDFVFYILKNSSFSFSRMNQLIETGFVSSIPGIFGIDKSNIYVGNDSVYVQSLLSIGLLSNDYGDSLFSTGVLAFGIPGLIILPLLYLSFGLYFQKKMNGCITGMLCISFYFLYVEISNTSIITFFRDFLIACIIWFFIFWLNKSSLKTERKTNYGKNRVYFS